MGNWNELHEPRKGIMLHYDDSASDPGAMEWLLRDPRCHVSYNWLVLDDGRLVVVAPQDKRAWHAGVCRPSNPAIVPYHDANSTYYGIAVAANERDHATPAQVATVVNLCKSLYAKHFWPLEETWRITGHNLEAWPRGRKVDPVGSRPSDPVLSLQQVRSLVSGSSS